MSPAKKSRKSPGGAKKRTQKETARRNESANKFARTRSDHKMETAEDYVEVIEKLVREKGEARTVDLASEMGVSNVTVSRIIGRLQRLGYVKTQPYRSIFLTHDGEDLAQKARERHETVLSFLMGLGVPASIANQDAEGIEHHVSDETLNAFERILEICRRDSEFRKLLFGD